MNLAASHLRRWKEDPPAFVRELFGVELDAWQVEVLLAATGHQRIALKASKGPGKSCVLAWLGWWFLLTRLHPKVVCTSITADNLKDGLWTELSKWQQRSELLTQAFTWNKERIVCNDHPKTWWCSARTWSKDADTNRQGEALAGVHADNVLFLCDESGGYPDAVMATAEAALANASEEEGREALLIQAGNPTNTSGPLYRACTVERRLWWVKEISGDPDDPNRAPRVSIQWAREQIEKYGRDNPWVLINVFGKFPPGQANTLISIDVASEAARRTVSEAELLSVPRVLGIDVARFGDDRTIFSGRQGRVAFPMKEFRTQDTMSIVGNAIVSIRKFKPKAIFVDTVGVGAGVADRLRELGYAVVDVNASASPKSNDPPCRNLRAEMWWDMSQWLKTGCIPPDAELLSELTAPTFKYPEGKLLLESKDDLKKRGLPSPDKADALALTFAYPVAPDAPYGTGKAHETLHDFEPYANQGQPAAQAEHDFNPYGGL